ncbi:MAG: imelysin family protein [Porticoccaceae bacterium]|nr:imelysin family protein [Porticoccaceae bacterium]MDG1308237.1 imelysin family protein [Porticoccaceae bacterium]
MLRFCSSMALLVLCLTGCVDQSRDVASPGEDSRDDNNTNTSDDNSTDSNAAFDRTALMTNLVDSIFIPNYQATATLADSFSGDSGPLAAYCDAIGSEDEETSLATAQTDWLDLMDAVQKTEMHIIGPALRNEEALHNRVYSYSTGSLATCALDQAVVDASSQDFQVSSRAFNQRGMGALEYLLFNSNLNHSCSSQVQATESWNELTQSERKNQRCGLAEKLAADVAEASNLIHSQWVEGDSPFRTQFLNEDSQGENFQLITDGIFYLETFTKSQKLTIPLGLDDKCSSVTCPGLVESPYSETSLRNVRTNAAEFLRIFNGGSGLGFDDLINQEGFTDISLRFQNQLSEVDDRFAQISGSLNDQLALVEADPSDPACLNAFANPSEDSTIGACSLAGLLKGVTDDLKIEFVTIVGVAIPGRVQSDND